MFGRIAGFLPLQDIAKLEATCRVFHDRAQEAYRQWYDGAIPHRRPANTPDHKITAIERFQLLGLPYRPGQAMRTLQPLLYSGPQSLARLALVKQHQIQDPETIATACAIQGRWKEAELWYDRVPLDKDGFLHRHTWASVALSLQPPSDGFIAKLPPLSPSEKDRRLCFYAAMTGNIRIFRLDRTLVETPWTG